MKQCFWICHHDWHKEEAFKGIFLWFATMLDTHPKPYLNLFHKSKTRAGSEGKGICHKAWQGEFDPRIHIVEGENWFTPKLSSVLHTHTHRYTHSCLRWFKIQYIQYSEIFSSEQKQPCDSIILQIRLAPHTPRLEN